jgi:hypothetical protein
MAWQNVELLVSELKISLSFKYNKIIAWGNIPWVSGQAGSLAPLLWLANKPSDVATFGEGKV